jgi:hypothetical protein
MERTLRAVTERVARISWRTEAGGGMIPSPALGPDSACGGRTDRYTDSVESITSSVVRTVIVRATADGDAGCQRVSLHADGAVALSAVHDGATLGVYAARWSVVGTWINAVLVDARSLRYTL